MEWPIFRPATPTLECGSKVPGLPTHCICLICQPPSASPPPLSVTSQLTQSVSSLSFLDTLHARSHTMRRFPQLQHSYLVELAAFSKSSTSPSKWHAPCSSPNICNVEIFKSQHSQPER